MAISKPQGNPKIDPKELVPLHKAVTSQLLSQIDDPKVLELAIKFLHNNGITAPPVDVNKEVSEENAKKTISELKVLQGRFQEQDEIGLGDIENVG